MAQIEVSERDRLQAEQFLVRVLEEQFPDGNFSRGSALRDHTVGAMAHVFALLRQEAIQIRRSTSLRLVDQLSDPEERAEAIDNLLDNWFVAKRGGRPVRGSVLIRFSQRHAGRIPTGTEFFRTPSLGFVLDSSSGIFYREDQLSPRISSTGEVLDYVLRVPVIAKGPGTQYEIPTGPFSRWDNFSRFTILVENDAEFTGGRDAETAEEALARVPDAITVRDLNSKRAIRAALREAFTTELIDILVVGMGDPGMMRDLVDSGDQFMRLHAGGHMDVYVTTPLRQRQVFESTVGGEFQDNQQAITIFKDTTVDDFRTRTKPGDILRVFGAGVSEPSRYVIRTVERDFLRVSDAQPFPSERPTELRNGNDLVGTITVAGALQSPAALFTSLDKGRYVRISSGPHPSTERDFRIESVDPVANTVLISPAPLIAGGAVEFRILDSIVQYSIGDVGPDYANKVALRTTGAFRRTWSKPGQILLPALPVYLIREVSVLAPSHPRADPASGRVFFETRVSREPSATPPSGSGLEYQVHSPTPLYTHSNQQTLILDVGTGTERQGQRGIITLDKRFEVADPVFDATTDVGKWLYINRAYHTLNRGVFRIEAVESETVVVLEKDDGIGWVPTPEQHLGWELTNKHQFDGRNIRVIYDTVQAFGSIASFLSDRSQRVACANTLGKAPHPVYLQMDLRYGVKPGATRAFSELEGVRVLSRFINDFPADEVLHISEIVSIFQATFADVIDYVELPMSVDYDLFAPDGRVISYTTMDAVTLSDDKLVSMAPENRLEDPVGMSVTDQTVRYLTLEDLINLTQIS